MPPTFPANRKTRRAIQKANGGALITRTIVIEGAAISEAVAQGASGSDLVMYHVSMALDDVAAQGGDWLKHSVVTIGEHPANPGALTIQAKTDRLLPEGTSYERMTETPAPRVGWWRRLWRKVAG